MRNTLKFILILTTIVLASSCTKSDNIRQPFAVLTVINAYTAAPRLTFALDRNNFHAGDYSTTRSFDILVGSRQFSFRGEAGGQNLVDTTFRIEPFTYYSSYAYGTATDPKVLLTRDSVLKDLGANAAIRFIHLGNDAGAVRVYQGDNLIEEIALRDQETPNSVTESQRYIPVPAGTHIYSVRDSSGNVIATSQSIQLRAGFHRSLILLGTRGNQANPLRLASN
ncbi:MULTISPECIES: DUF4397 domain-containing protein [Sphingobacterium]|uniref:DUF4397 domain-containing protein n=1 Tax=Sphingobacterium populi TaxID=1812824 RepID=A0ABW5UI75_9SPHI|nr:DUF4397 domain-containing protein [Sphingobacterium sp. CFCC 11742]